MTLNEILNVREKLLADLDTISSADQLEIFKLAHLTRKGTIAAMFDELRTVSKEGKPQAGKELNELRQSVEARFKEQEESIGATSGRHSNGKKLEDSHVLTPEILDLNFGTYTSYLVQQLTKDIKAEGAMKDWVEKEYIAKLMAASEDARMLKLADRLDTYRCLEFNVKRNPIKYIMQTQEHYFPLAAGSANARMKYLIKELQKEQNKFLG